MEWPSRETRSGAHGSTRSPRRRSLLLVVLLTTLLAVTGCREPSGAPDSVAADSVAPDSVAADAVAPDVVAADPDPSETVPTGDAAPDTALEAAAGDADPTAAEPQADAAPSAQAEEPADEPVADEPAQADPLPEEPAGDDAAGTPAAADSAPSEGGAEAGTYQVVEPLVEEPRTTFDAAEQVLDEGEDYLARIVTSQGPILVELYEDRVPNTVNNFVFLALHRFYEGVPFHRVLEDFMAQTGDPTGTGRGGPGYQFADEIDPELTHDAAGVLSMANAGPNTNGSQFFITFTATPWLDGNHPVFGRVVEGMDVLDRLTRVSPDEPMAVAMLEDSVESVVARGVALSGPGDRTIGEHLDAALGTTPVVGQSFTVDGYRGVVGRVGDEPAVGFFAQPDVIERVEVLTRAEPSTQERAEPSTQEQTE